ncbi:hypothetical protein R6Q59_017124 [Mikania micrantha]
MVKYGNNINNVNRIQRFKHLKTPTFQTPEKRITVEELLNINHVEHMQTYFTCLASITEVFAYRTWYYALCSDCTKKVYPEGRNIVCEDHGSIIEPNYMYCVNTPVADETSTTNMVFFNEAMTSILNIKCAEMVINHGYTDPKTIPTPILFIRGIPKILHIALKRDGTICVHKAVDTFATAAKKPSPHIDAQYNAKPLTKSSKRQVLHAKDALSQKSYKKKIKH